MKRPERLIQNTKVVDKPYYVRDPETRRRRVQWRQLHVPCVPTRVCVSCSRSDLQCRC